MKSQTSLAARNCRLQEWSKMVHSCNNRPIGISVDEWSIQCLSSAKKYKLYKSSINKSLHFVQRSLSSSTRGQRVITQLNLSRK